VAVQTQKWQSARLFPITGIGGQAEEERRGSSVFLSVMRSVQEFGRAITSRMDAPSGKIETFIECEFPLNAKKSRPDGLIRITGRNNVVWIVTCPRLRVHDLWESGFVNSPLLGERGGRQVLER
jgi:hypothetical protein